MNKGLSLIEAIVGIGLILVFFVGIVGVLRISFSIVSSSRARSGAISLANEQMERIRNLPYGEVGTVGGIPAGNIPQEEHLTVNGINYTRRTLIQYVDDPADGEGADDENGITTDYKRARVEVSWPGRYYNESIVLVSNFVPKGIETSAGGGTLKITVLNAANQPVSGALVHIENSEVDPPVSIDTYTNSDGKVVFPGAPSVGSYKITITKSGYSSAQTYDVTSENVDPRPPHLTILEGETTTAIFYIDLVSDKTIKTYKPAGIYSWSDSFSGSSHVATTSNVVIQGGEAILDSDESGYKSSGYLISETLTPEQLNQWLDFSWTENEISSTTLSCQILYQNGGDWVPVPNTDLAGNEAGFDISPVDLSGLSTTTYPQLRLKANLSTTDASNTPALLGWTVQWKSNRIPFPSIPFHMRGDKIIGYDAGGDPIYKYYQNLATDENGSLLVENLEYDNYYINVDGGSVGYDVSESCPFQPANIAPGTHNVTNLVLVPHQTNTLLVSVQNDAGDFIPGANVHLYRSGYDQSILSSETCGQSFFSPLTAADDYTLEVSKSGYDNFSLSDVSVNGYTTLKVILSPL